MGYRNPGYDEVEEGNSEFEWDGERQQWLFRRNGRAAPILVTDEEKERYETFKRRGTIAIMAVVFALYVLGDYLIGSFLQLPEPEIRDLRTPIALLVGLPIGAADYSLISRIATRRLRGRAPQGPARTRLEVWREEVEQKSWLDYVWPAIIMMVILWIHRQPDGPGDWAWLAIAGLIIAYFLCEVAMTLRGKRL